MALGGQPDPGFEPRSMRCKTQRRAEVRRSTGRRPASLNANRRRSATKRAGARKPPRICGSVERHRPQPLLRDRFDGDDDMDFIADHGVRGMGYSKIPSIDLEIRSEAGMRLPIMLPVPVNFHRHGNGFCDAMNREIAGDAHRGIAGLGHACALEGQGWELF